MSQLSPDPALVVARPTMKTRSFHWSKDRLISVALITPSIIAVAVFVYIFIAQTAYISLVRWNDFAPKITMCDSWRLFSRAKINMNSVWRRANSIT